MASNRYSDLDFNNIKQNLIDYLRTQSEWSDYDFTGSNLSMLLDLLAYNSQYAAFLANTVANESFLPTAVVRDNVVLLARQLGYTPTSVTGASAFFDLSFQLPSQDYPGGYPNTIEIRPGAVFAVAYTAAKTSRSYNLSTVDTITTTVSDTGIALYEQVEFKEGLIIEESFTVQSTDTVRSYNLGNKNIDTTTIRVEVQENPPSDETESYSLVSDLSNLTTTSRIYWLDEIDDAKYKLTFGDGIFGFRPAVGSVINVTYMVSSGPEANGIQGTSNFAFIGNVFDSEDGRILVNPTITNVPKLDGGSLIEDVSSIKFRASRGFSAQNRAVTVADYEQVVRGLYPAARDVYVFGGEDQNPPQYGKIFVVIKPKTGNYISNAAKADIKRGLRDYKVASTDVNFLDPGIINIEVVSSIHYDPSRTRLSSSAVRSAVITTLNGYAQSETLQKFGGIFRFSRALTLIDTAEKSITRNDTFVVLRRDVPVLYNTAATYYLNFGNSLKTNTARSIVSSSGFNLFDSNETYYLADDGKGLIYSYYFNTSGVRTIENKRFGRINYTTGVVELGFERSIKITGTTIPGYLYVRVLPEFSDVEARNEMYLNFDVSKSTITVTAD